MCCTATFHFDVDAFVFAYVTNCMGCYVCYMDYCIRNLRKHMISEALGYSAKCGVLFCHAGSGRKLTYVSEEQTGPSQNTHTTRSRLRLKCDGTRAETRFRLSATRTSPFKSAGASVQSNTGSRVVRISGSNAGYTMFRGSVKGTGYPLHSTVSPSHPLPCVTVCHHISTGLYHMCL